MPFRCFGRSADCVQGTHFVLPSSLQVQPLTLVHHEVHLNPTAPLPLHKPVCMRGGAVSFVSRFSSSMTMDMRLSLNIKESAFKVWMALGVRLVSPV
jgi:hypothetical protein